MRTINNTEQFLILLTYINHSEPEKELIHTLLPKIESWDNFISLAAYNKVMPICYYNAIELGLIDLLPKAVLETIKSDADKIKQANSDRIAEALKFLTLFKEKGIETVMLKGICFAETFYENTYYKRMNDVDLLIHKERLDEIYAIYEQLNYFFIGERFSGDKKKSDNVMHVSPTYVSRNFKCMIGTQWGLKSPLGCYKINYETLWQRTQPLNFHGLDLLQLSPEDNLHHLCVHLGFFKITLKDLMDIYNLVRAYPNLNWSLFHEIVKESKSEKAAYYALKLSNALYYNANVEDLLTKIEPFADKMHREGAIHRANNIPIVLKSSLDYIQEIEKAIANFDLCKKFTTKWKLLFGIYKLAFLPSRDAILKLNVLENPSWHVMLKKRFSTVFKIFRTLALEVGWPLLMAFFIKVKVDVVIATFQALYKKQLPFEKEKELYANNMGITLQELNQLVDQVQ